MTAPCPVPHSDWAAVHAEGAQLPPEGVCRAALREAGPGQQAPGRAGPSAGRMRLSPGPDGAAAGQPAEGEAECAERVCGALCRERRAAGETAANGDGPHVVSVPGKGHAKHCLACPALPCLCAAWRYSSHTHPHTHTYTHHTHSHIHTRPHTRTRSYPPICTCTHTYTPECMQAHMHAYTHIHTCTHTHTHTHTHASRPLLPSLIHSASTSLFVVTVFTQYSQYLGLCLSFSSQGQNAVLSESLKSLERSQEDLGQRLGDLQLQHQQDNAKLQGQLGEARGLTKDLQKEVAQS